MSASPHEAAHFGRRAIPPLDLRDRADPAVQQLITGLFAEAADYVEVIRRLWDIWEDDRPDPRSCVSEGSPRWGTRVCRTG